MGIDENFNLCLGVLIDGVEGGTARCFNGVKAATTDFTDTKEQRHEVATKAVNLVYSGCIEQVRVFKNPHEFGLIDVMIAANLFDLIDMLKQLGPGTPDG